MHGMLTQARNVVREDMQSPKMVDTSKVAFGSTKLTKKEANNLVESEAQNNYTKRPPTDVDVVGVLPSKLGKH